MIERTPDPERLKTMTTDQHAAHQLLLSCRRLDSAIASRDEARGEQARGDTVKHMAKLLEEFGLTYSAEIVGMTVDMFDGRRIEKEQPCPSTS